MYIIHEFHSPRLFYEYSKLLISLITRFVIIQYRLIKLYIISDIKNVERNIRVKFPNYFFKCFGKNLSWIEIKICDSEFYFCKNIKYQFQNNYHTSCIISPHNFFTTPNYAIFFRIQLNPIQLK